MNCNRIVQLCVKEAVCGGRLPAIIPAYDKNYFVCFHKATAGMLVEEWDVPEWLQKMAGTRGYLPLAWDSVREGLEDAVAVRFPRTASYDAYKDKTRLHFGDLAVDKKSLDYFLKVGYTWDSFDYAVNSKRSKLFLLGKRGSVVKGVIMGNQLFDRTTDKYAETTGKWKMIDGIRHVGASNLLIAQCSHCGKQFCDILNRAEYYAFCPVCGAKMDLEESE